MLTYDQIRDALPAGDPCAPLLEALYTRNEWLLRPMLEYLEPALLPAYLDDVRAIWGVLEQVRPMEPAGRIEEAIRGLQFHSIEFLKLQIQFAKTGTYRSDSFEAVREQVYSSEPVMQQYLDGLLLTYIAWPNHHRLLRFYRERYLANGPRGACLEVGPGHGWLAREQLGSSPQNTLLGIDVSPHSVQYTQAVLAASGFDAGRYEIREQDAMEALRDGRPRFERIVIAEVIEHLERPDELLEMARRCARPDAIFFITTVVNIEAVDHIYLFRTLEEVRELITGCGLSIEDELDLELKLNLKMDATPYEVALVCR